MRKPERFPVTSDFEVHVVRSVSRETMAVKMLRFHNVFDLENLFLFIDQINTDFDINASFIIMHTYIPDHSRTIAVLKWENWDNVKKEIVPMEIIIAGDN